MAEKIIAKPTESDCGREKADELSLRFCHLKNVVRLAAFAAESRRVLEGINEMSSHGSRGRQMQECIDAGVKHSGSWMMIEDVSSDVLDWVADQIDDLHSDVTNHMYAMALGDKFVREVSHV